MNNYRLYTFDNNKYNKQDNTSISIEMRENYFNLPPIVVKDQEGVIINAETHKIIRDTYVIEVTKSDGTVLIYPSILECSLDLKVSRSVIYDRIAKEKPLISNGIIKILASCLG